jgi:2-dehydro-3-deoxygalactonokinase
MRFVAVDWGTTNRRTYLIENGSVVSTERDDRGVASVPEGGFDAEVDALVARHPDTPILMAGMIGSNRGWIDAGYVPVPAGLDALAFGVSWPRSAVAVVPGLKVTDGDRGDVMRGEEVQLLGAVAAGLAPPDATLCQPGTHCKWARMTGGEVADFTTAMTGELFALLRDHALIGREMAGVPGDDDAFAQGVAASADGDLLAALFGVRPASLLGLRAEGAASYVSGLLIGSDVRARVRPGETVYLLADGTIGALYARAIAAAGATAVHVDSHAAFVAGITRIQERLS